MKKIINGKLYNTDTARLVAEHDNGRSRNDFGYCEERLYLKKTGEFFLSGEGGAMTRYARKYEGNCYCGGTGIIPVTEREAKLFVEQYCDADTYIEVFGEVEE